MSSATSTEATRASTGSGRPGHVEESPADRSLQPWQFFVLAALGCATAATFMARGQGLVVVIMLSVLMAAAAFIGLTALRTVQPLVTPEVERSAMIGRRTRAALEREKLLALRAIKELEFDRAMGKLSEDDFKEMAGRLRVRAGRLIRQLDAGAGYRGQIEQEIAKRLSDADARLKPSRSGEADADAERDDSEWSAKASAERLSEADRSAMASAERLCAACDTPNEADARFCKGCGQKL
jgi:hypothetical protein